MTRVDRAAAVALISLFHISSAAAQSADAEALFREGRKLIKAGKVAAGCEKLDASERIETSVGTLLNLGDCREKTGKLASAWAAFKKAEAVAKRSGNDDKRQAEAKRRADRLEPQLSMLTIQVERRVDGLVVKRGETVLEDGAWNSAVPVDPGTYVISAEAPGYKPWRTDLTVLHKTKRVVAVPMLEKLPPPPVESGSPTVAGTSPARPVVASRGGAVGSGEMVVVTRRSGGTWSGARKLAVGLGVLGAGSIGAGVYFGMRARDLQSDADARCPLAVCADAEALRLNDRAQTNATRANIFYIAGGAVAASALVMWLVGAPSDQTVVTPAVGGGQLGVAVSGSF